MSCNKCKQLRCCCTPSNLVPTPYYETAPVCPEDNCQKIYINQTSIGLRIESSWNVPVCGGSSLLSVPDLISVPVGEYLHHEEFGYFKILSFDSVRGLLSIQNPCFPGNANPGTEIPRCTTFSVGAPPCCEDVGQSGVFVAVDFTAPANGACIDITLTSEEGLVAGNNVEIGSGIYLLNEIKANNIVNICNQGDGIIPGTPVIAKNIAGQYQYPVTLLTLNPCTQATVTDGSAIVCKDNLLKPLTGASVGHVLTLLDAVTGDAHYADSGVAALTAVVTALTSLVQEGSSAQIAPGTTLTFGSPTITTSAASVMFTNPSATRSMKTFVFVRGHVVGSGDGTQPFTLNTYLNLDTGSGPSIVGQLATSLGDLDAYGDEVTKGVILTIPPGNTVNVQASVTLDSSGANGYAFTTEDCQAEIWGIGVVL